MQNRFGKSQKPLFVISGPVRAKGYLSNFTPFETIRFLDPEKLVKRRRQSLEVGTLEAAGRSATLVAEIRNGAVIGLTLRGCPGCVQGPKKRIDKKTLLAIREKMPSVLGKGRFRLPGLTDAPIAKKKGNGDIRIPIWPFPPIVIIFEPGSFCVAIQIGHFPPGGPGTVFCVWCPETGGMCM